MDFVTVSTGLILPYWMGLPIRYIQWFKGFENQYVVIGGTACDLIMELSAHEQAEDSLKFLGIMENIAQVDLLITDDFGLMNLDVEKYRHLFEILDSREGRKSTVIVSQIPVKELYDLFKDCAYADACLDRVLCKAYRLEFKGESLRN